MVKADRLKRRQFFDDLSPVQSTTKPLPSTLDRKLGGSASLTSCGVTLPWLRVSPRPDCGLWKVKMRSMLTPALKISLIVTGFCVDGEFGSAVIVTCRRHATGDRLSSEISTARRFPDVAFAIGIHGECFLRALRNCVGATTRRVGVRRVIAARRSRFRATCATAFMSAPARPAKWRCT